MDSPEVEPRSPVPGIEKRNAYLQLISESPEYSYNIEKPQVT